MYNQLVDYVKLSFMALSHAILATLLDQPCSGYDLRKRFEGSVGFFWQASFQQIYRELSRLEDQDLLSAQTIHQQNRPDKKIYQVTEAGKDYLKAWMIEPCDIPASRDDLLVKLFAGYLLPRETFLVELRQHQTQHQQRLTVYQQIEQQFFTNPQSLSIEEKFHYLTLLNGIRHETQWLAWCEEAIAILSEHSASHAMNLRPANSADLDLLRHWDEQPHVIASDPNDDWHWDIELDRTPNWREQLIAEVDGRAIGFIQIIDPAREESHYWGEVPETLRAIDIWIGEVSDLGKGYGTQMMQLALTRCFSDPSVTAVLVDPLVSNTRVHRFYERLGFQLIERRQFGDDDCFVYRLNREDWHPPDKKEVDR